MHRYLYLGTAAALALVVTGPAASAAVTSTRHVLTISKTGGRAVSVGAITKAALAKGMKVTFAEGSEKVNCGAATFSAKVTSNPAAPGKATESLTAQNFGKCAVSVSGSGITINSIVASNLPYRVTASDSKGDPVKVSGQGKSKPIVFTVTATVKGFGKVICHYAAGTVTGSAAAKGSAITIVKQKFKVATGSNLLCVASATMSATFGPVRDTSVHGHPAVFVN